jgi:archaellin
MLFEDFKGMTNKIIQYDSKVQINYFITAPEYLNLRIDNKYGDIYMENNSGNTSITLSNGSLKANSLKRAHDLTLSFCDATIRNTQDAIIDASFSEITVGESGTLKISGVSSKFDLKLAGRINAESRRDKFFIGTVNSLHGESYFTDFRIDKISGDVDLTTKYGSLDAEIIEKEFTGIRLNSGYSDIDLAFDPLASYNLDIRHTNTSLSLPDKNASLEKKQVSEENKEYITFGKVGKNPGNVNVNIEANRGRIILK